MIVAFLEVADAEYRAAVDYYEAERVGLGGQFAAEVERTLARIVAFPAGWPRLSKRTRRCQMKRFPYGVIYQHRDNRILIVAIMHLKREPGYWQQRI